MDELNTKEDLKGYPKFKILLQLDRIRHRHDQVIQILELEGYDKELIDDCKNISDLLSSLYHKIYTYKIV